MEEDSIFSLLDEIDATAQGSYQPSVHTPDQLHPSSNAESRCYTSQQPIRRNDYDNEFEYEKRDGSIAHQSASSRPVYGDLQVTARPAGRQQFAVASRGRLTFPPSISRYIDSSAALPTQQTYRAISHEDSHGDTQLSQPQRVILPQYAFNEPSQQVRVTSPIAAFSSSPAYKASQRQIDHQAIQARQPNSLIVSNDTATPKVKGELEFQPSQRAFSHTPIALPHAPRLVRGIELLSTHELPDRFRSVFRYPNFNAVQSKCFQTVYCTNDNFVLSSPTGSGKTVIFELAILRLIDGFASGQFKIVYQAPTKSLCSERQRDWAKKFAPFDIQCAELTGDTETDQMQNVKKATIIVTTPEKWDSMTRRWKDHARLMQMVKLFLIDEVHMLKEERGATLEAVVSRMKSIGSDVRFIALSATVPNDEDIATWLGKNSLNQQIQAPRERFGAEFRPVILQKHVVGYQAHGNDFSFEKTLEPKLVEVVTKYSQKKPIMVFCATRAATMTTARLLANWWATNSPQGRYWEAPRRQIAVANINLQDCVPSAVAFHHAGLTSEERSAVETGFLNGDINVICCTSTLAVGVNLPCHLVIIKNTVQYSHEGLIEYSDLDMMQMLGRAGRPQFDNSAVAVIMTRQEKVKKYERMVSGQEVLESCLHQHLTDHMNVEIGLGTITNLSTAKKWLSGTFLYVRMRENPEHYHLDTGDNTGNLEDRLERICSREIDLLREHGLINGDTSITSTEYGFAMARYSVHFETTQAFLSLPPKAKLSEILAVLSQADEFKDLRFRQNEKPKYKDLNKSPSIKFPIPVNLDLPAHKVSLIIQSQLGGVELPTMENENNIRFQYNMEANTIFQQVRRLIRCIIDMILCGDDSISLRNALLLCRSLAAKCWDDSPLQLRQLDNIGVALVRRLVNANIRSIEELENTPAHQIESTLARNPPFGMKILDAAKSFPKLRVSMQVVGNPAVEAREGAKINIKAQVGFMNDKPPIIYRGKSVYVIFLAETSDGRQVHFARISGKAMSNGQDIKFSVALTSPIQIIVAHVMCDEFAGTLRSASLKPTIPSIAWPPNGQQVIAPVNKPSMNSSKRLTTRPNPRRGNNDEFGDDDLDDVDMLQAAAANVSDDLEFRHIDTFGGEIAPRTMNNIAKKKQVASNATDDWQPKKLGNGNWECNHKCKDKNACKHMCCRDGLDKVPKAPKNSIGRTEKNADGPNSASKQTKLAKGQTTLSLSAMKQSRAKKPATSSSIAKLDLTDEADRYHGLPSRVPPSLERLERLHTSTQKDRSNVISTFARSNAACLPESGRNSRLSFLPDLQETQNTGCGESWPDYMQELPNFYPTMTANTKSSDFASPSLRDNDVEMDLEDPKTLPTGDDEQYFGDNDSILEDAMVGLADSQDLQAKRPAPVNATSDIFNELPMDDEPASFDRPSTPKNPPSKKGKKLPSSNSPLSSPQIGRVVRHIALVDTSSPFFPGPQSSKRTSRPKESNSDLQPITKKVKSVVDTSVVDDRSKEAAQIPTSPSATPNEGSEDSKSTPNVEAVDEWLLREFGQYVDFV